ncbi:hypothetical protein SteCoe_25395 [Stentor coeruleus]|uniref:Uncharacterized protein n=1 Tax=Stentor coeruleus TaxID=5963 RepID=A0A1R2BFC0_9CILI|nr:hypothetical protein SteCoe_25395 [Stentor coeruleus]
MEISKVSNEKSQDLTGISSKSKSSSKNSYRIVPSYNPNFSDDFYIKKKRDKKHKFGSALKIQRVFRARLNKKKLEIVLKIQKRTEKPILALLEKLIEIGYKKVKLNWEKFSMKSNQNKDLSFSINAFRILTGLAESHGESKKELISIIYDGFPDETKVLITEGKLSNTFLDLFNDEEREKVIESFADEQKLFREFNDFNEISFTKFDFLEYELPETITKSTNPYIFKKATIEKRVEELQEKISKENENLLKELTQREELNEQNDILKIMIKKLLSLRKV